MSALRGWYRKNEDANGGEYRNHFTAFVKLIRDGEALPIPKLPQQEGLATRLSLWPSAHRPAQAGGCSPQPRGAGDEATSNRASRESTGSRYSAALAKYRTARISQGQHMA
jgi:hypothetical protein